MNHREFEIDQLRLGVATLVACTVRTLGQSGQIQEDDWFGNVMEAYNHLRETGADNTPALEMLSWSMEALRQLRKG